MDFSALPPTLPAILACCLLTPVLGAQEPLGPLTAPHPSLVQPPKPVNQVSEDDWDEFNPSWVALRPSWVEQEELSEDHEDFCRRVANALALSPDEAALLRDATRPHAVGLSYRLTGPAGTMLSGSESVMPGRPQAFGDLARIRGVRDFDVEIASGSGIADPIIAQQQVGSSFGLLIEPRGDAWLVEAAVVHSRAEAGDEVPLRYAQLGGKRRLQTALSESGSSMVLAPGATGSLALPLADGRTATLDLTLAAGPMAAPTLPGGLVSVHAPWLRLDRGDAGPVGRSLAGALSRGLAWTDGRGHWLLSGNDAAELASALLAATPQAEQWTLSCTLRDAAEGGAVAVALEAPVLAGRELRFAQGRMVDSLVDWYVEVAQVARIADPVFQDYFGGVQARLLPTRLADGRLRLEGEVVFTAVEIGDASTIRLAAATPGESGYDGEVPAAPAQVMGLEHPDLKEVRFAGTWETDADGRVRLSRSAGGLLGPESELVLELQLR